MEICEWRPGEDKHLSQRCIRAVFAKIRECVAVLAKPQVKIRVFFAECKSPLSRRVLHWATPRSHLS